MSASATHENENTSFVIGARLEKLRNPQEEARLATWLKSLGSTANESRDAMTNLIWEWHESGGDIKARVPKERGKRPKCAVKSLKHYTLDIARMELLGELTLYSIYNEPVLLDLETRLIRVEESFRSNTRRTLNRQFEKIDSLSRRRAVKSLWPLMFWEDVAFKIAHFQD